ncbi:AMP-binding protein [Microbacterium immunditiarum]|uniref:4-coumarate--CoA ligase n=1 Tax=Microbacterium immunditiarum TaxID=337480 RepID=A0A7Y9GM63_9MICO|nr:AMP-binding protein [Microbacterium immunditiarum]NYE18989.1 4-coumarate--CoA ligase [Microbacterium immunditiarum]
MAEADIARPAIVDGGTGAVLSYGELVERIAAAARALTDRGVAAGDVVALHASNSPRFVIAFHAIGAIGATATPIPVLATEQDVSRQLVAAGAEFLISDPDLLDRGRAAGRDAGVREAHVIDVTELAAAPVEGPTSWAPPLHDVVLPFSSGTTGYPKGVRLSHRNLVANVVQIEDRMGIERDDVVMGVLPFFHIYGLTMLVSLVLRRRATLVTMARFDLDKFLRLIESRRATFAFIAPPIALLLAKHPSVDGADLSTLRELFSGAAPLDEKLSAALERRLGVRVRQGYGMSEMSPVSHFAGHGEGAPRGSVGPPVPGTENRIVGLDGSLIQPPDTGLSEVGELWVRGPNVMSGYLDNPRATAETIDSEGFLHTGDLVAVDSDLNVYVLDRLKELIKYKGYPVPPAELEALLISHPLVADAAVVGQVHPDAGEIPVAFVVPRGDDVPDAGELMSFVAARVSPYKRIRRVEFCESIPKSTAGKILRRELRMRVNAQMPSTGPSQPPHEKESE